MTDVKVPIWKKIVSYLVKNSNEVFTPKEIGMAIDVKDSSVRGRLSELFNKNIKNKPENLKKISKGKYSFVELIKGGNFRRWEVSFKLIETLKHKNRKSDWDNTIMDLSANVKGIVPRLIEQNKVKEVVGNRLFSNVLDVMNNEGVSLWNAVNENKSIFIDATVINENPLDRNYDSKWNGEIEFTNSQAKRFTFDLNFEIQENRW